MKYLKQIIIFIATFLIVATVNAKYFVMPVRPVVSKPFVKVVQRPKPVVAPLILSQSQEDKRDKDEKKLKIKVK